MRSVLCAAIVAAFFLTAPAAWAGIALVQATSCGPSSFPGQTCTIAATGSGNLIVVGWETAGGANLATTLTGVTDNSGNSYVEAGPAKSVDTGTGSWIDIWYAKNSKPGATSVVITPSASVAQAGVVIWEFSGVDANAPLDQTAILSNQPVTATPSAARVTNSSPNDAIISLAVVGYTLTGIASGNTFTSDSSIFSNGWAHYIASSPGTYGATWNQSPSGTYGSSTVSFKAAGLYSACDLNQDGTANIVDVQLATNMAMAPTNCTAPFGQCNVGFVQAVLAAAANGVCAIPALNIAPSTINFGDVPVGGSSTQSLTVTGIGTASTTISQITVSGAGFSFSGPSLPLTLAVGQSATFNVTFSPVAAGSVGGGIVISANALNTASNPSQFDPSLSGNGVTAGPHTVSLNWIPSTSTKVASYKVYRTTSSSSSAPPTPYPSLGSLPATSCSPTTCSYIDAGVQAGQRYWYYATAVDSGNNSSAPSNTTQAVIPTP